jgi:hypothetical protein
MTTRIKIRNQVDSSVRSVSVFGSVILMSGLLAAQTGVPSNVPQESSPDRVEIQKLLEAMSTQQKAMIEQQKAIAEQQRQISEQGQEIENLKQQLGSRPQMVSVSEEAPPLRQMAATWNTATAADGPASHASDALQQEKPKESPLSFRIGGAEFTPGGFVDLTAFWRSTNVGSGYGTNFFSIPFANTFPGQITETRLTAENSRLTLKATSRFRGSDVMGYVETDFHGNDPTNLNVSANSSTLRLRQYWVNVRRGKWEVLAGQAWSWLTPNRVGLSALPTDVFYGLGVDANYQVGLTWTRSPQVRGIFHATEHWGLGLALENPDQFAGQTGQVTFPAAFNVPGVTAQFDAANQTTTPNLHPDVIAKIAYDAEVAGKHYHLEGAGLLTTVRVLPQLGGPNNTKTGGGVSAAFNLEVFKHFRLIANGFWSDGGARYIFGSGPEVVLSPRGSLSLVHAGSGIGGFEWQASKANLFGVYYGADYFQRNFFLDTSAGAKPNTFVGFGGPGSSNAANRAIQEPTIDWTITLWKHDQYGALQLVNQVSYLTRASWNVAPGQPKNARSTMVWSNIRYILP